MTRKAKRTNREKDNVYWWTMFAFKIAIAHCELEEVSSLHKGSKRAFEFFREKVKEDLTGHVTSDGPEEPTYSVDDISKAFYYLEEAEKSPGMLDSTAIDALVNLVGLRPSALHKMFPHMPETQIRKIAKEFL